MILNKEQILQSQDLPKELVNVPEWGGEVYVRALTGTERDAFETSIVGGNASSKDLSNIRARLAALTLCDEEGKALFSLKEAVDLGQKSAKALDRVFSVAQRLNGIGAGDVDELAKN